MGNLQIVDLVVLQVPVITSALHRWGRGPGGDAPLWVAPLLGPAPTRSPTLDPPTHTFLQGIWRPWPFPEQQLELWPTLLTVGPSS